MSNVRRPFGFVFYEGSFIRPPQIIFTFQITVFKKRQEHVFPAKKNCENAAVKSRPKICVSILGTTQEAEEVEEEPGGVACALA